MALSFAQPQQLDIDLYQRLVVAEEAIYTNASEPMVNWDADDLKLPSLLRVCCRSYY